MEYKYQYQVQPSDLWQLQMYYTYSSYLAIINIIFIVSSIALLYALWGTSPWWLRILLLFFLSLFTVIQPLGVYLRSKKALKDHNDTLKLTLNEQEQRIIKKDSNKKIIENRTFTLWFCFILYFC